MIDENKSNSNKCPRCSSENIEKRNAMLSTDQKKVFVDTICYQCGSQWEICMEIPQLVDVNVYIR